MLIVVLSACGEPARCSVAPAAGPHPGVAVPAALAPPRDLGDVQLIAYKREQARREQPARPAVRTAPARKAVKAPEAVRNPQLRASRAKPRTRTAASAAVPAAATDAGPVVAFALAQVGKPYRWAASGPNAYDCSGLVMAAYWRAGVQLPHQTGGIIRYGRPVSRAQLQPGDIVFPQPGHVAIYLGGGMIVHAPHAGDHVRVAKLYAFWAARRI